MVYKFVHGNVKVNVIFNHSRRFPAEIFIIPTYLAKDLPNMSK